jgi:uncharacterized protein (PEP-CTERM system associated)
LNGLYRARMKLLRPGGVLKAKRGIRPVLMLGLSGVSIGGLAFAQAQQPVVPDTGGPTGIQVTPSISVSELFTDNTAGTQSNQFQFVSEVTPGISISGETPHAKINFNYLPNIVHFDNGGGTDRIDQNFNTNGSVTPIDNLTVPFQGYANTEDAGGNASNQQGILVPTNNRILYYIGNIAPHYHTQYSDLATFDLTYSINSTNTSVEGANVPGLGINSTDSLGQNVLASIGSADAFGRLGARADLSHTTNTGSGMNTASTTGVYTVSLNYHINRTYSFSGSLGYQSINYPANGQSAAYMSSGVTWTVGLTITPNQLSTIALGYGKQQGSYNPTLQAGYALGPRTNINASYLVTVQNQLTAALQNLKYLVYDQFGNPIDSRTGLPFSAVNQTFGSQNVLFRDKPALVAVSHQFTRSAITLTGQYEVRNSLTGIQQNIQVTGATVNYSRQFSPLVQGNMSLGYTQSTSKTAGAPEQSAHSLSLSGQLLYNLSDTTTITVIENLFKTTSNMSANNSQTQQLTVGLRKSF